MMTNGMLANGKIVLADTLAELETRVAALYADRNFFFPNAQVNHLPLRSSDYNQHTINTHAHTMKNSSTSIKKLLSFDNVKRILCCVFQLTGLT